MTKSIIELSEVGVQLPELWVMLHLYEWQYADRCGEMVAHAAFSSNIGWTFKLYLRNANKTRQKKQQKNSAT